MDLEEIHFLSNPVWNASIGFGNRLICDLFKLFESVASFFNCNLRTVLTLRR